jgi:hypothetical protein
MCEHAVGGRRCPRRCDRRLARYRQHGPGVDAARRRDRLEHAGQRLGRRSLGATDGHRPAGGHGRGLDGHGGLVQASYRPAGATTWQLPVPVSAKSASDLQVALDSQGNAVAAWLLGGADKVVQAATRPAVSGVWQSPVTVSDSDIDAGNPALAVDPAGTATAMWSDPDGIHSADRPPGGAWSGPVMLPGSAGGTQPDLAVDPAGDVTAVWNEGDGAKGPSRRRSHARRRQSLRRSGPGSRSRSTRTPG